MVTGRKPQARAPPVAKEGSEFCPPLCVCATQACLEYLSARPRQASDPLPADTRKGMTAAEAAAQAHKSMGEKIAAEFGNTCAKIGILIAMAAITGKSMLDSY